MSIHRQRGQRNFAFWQVAAIAAILASVAWLVLPAVAQEKAKQDNPTPAAKPAAPGTGAAKAMPKAAAGKTPVPAAAKPSEPASAAKPAAAEPAEASAPPPAAPVHYKQDVSDEVLEKSAERFKKDKTPGNVQKMIRAQAFAGGDEAQFDSYYSEFAFPRWTSPKHATSLPDFRRELRRDFVNAKSGAPYDRLLQLTLDFMTKAMGPDYHPVVRYNATMVLGDLNVREFSPGTRNQIEPHPEALKVLLAAVESSDSDAVRVAALLGLLRHAKDTAANSTVGISVPQRRDGQVIPLLVKLVTSPAPAGRSPEAHGWLRAKAIEVLAELRSVGPNGSVVTALVGVIGDKSAPMMTRCAAVRALGSLDYKGFGALAPSQLAVPIGQLVAEACTAELRKARPAAGSKAAPKAAAGGMGSGMSSMMSGASMGAMPGMPGMSGMPGMGSPMYGGAGAKEPEDAEDAERVLRLRRNLKYYLNAARLGLNGPVDNQTAGLRMFAKSAKNLTDETLAADPDYRFVDGILNSVKNQIRLLDTEDAEYRTLSQDLKVAKDALQELLKGGPLAPPPALGKAPARASAKGAAKK